MKDTRDHRDRIEQTLTSDTEKVEMAFAKFVRENPKKLQVLTVLVTVLVLSPLILFWVDGIGGKDWSETVKNVVESGAVLAAVFAVIKWVNERRDRATEVLLKLDENFQKDAVVKGKDSLEAQDFDGRPEEIKALDGLMRFYVVLFGVLIAKQVPVPSLSSCFRYWMAFYFRKDRPQFRAYVNRSFPTVREWLLDDCAKGCPFFRPLDFWKPDEVVLNPEELYPKTR